MGHKMYGEEVRVIRLTSSIYLYVTELSVKLIVGLA